MDEINLNVPLDDELKDRINLGVSPYSTQLPADVAAKRAFKIAQGTPEDQEKPTRYEELYQQLQQGQEQTIRDTIASNNRRRNIQFQEQLVTQAIARKGSGLNKNELDFLLSTTTLPTGKWSEYALHAWPEDPASVVEENYAKHYTDWLDKAAFNNDSSFQQAKAELGDDYQQLVKAGRSVLAKSLYAQTKAEEIDMRLKDQSTAGYTADFLKRFFPGYDDAKMRGLVPGTGLFDGLLIGNNKDIQAETLLMKPFDLYRKEFDTIVDKLAEHNLQLAKDFIDYVIGKSRSDVAIDNAFNIIDATAVVGAGKFGANLVRKGLAAGEVRKAVKEAVKSLDETPTKATVAEAAGDLETAAVLKTTNKLLDDMKPVAGADPAAVGFDRLPSALKTEDPTKLRASPGKVGGTELANRLADASESLADVLMERVKNMMKVQRTPGVFAIEEAVRALKETIKDSYIGIRSSILDVTDPVRNPISTTYRMDVVLGRADGTLFATREEAEGFASLNGILEPRIYSNKAGGHSIVIGKEIPETSDIVRDFLIKTANNQSPEADGWLGLMKNYMGWARTPEETMALEQRINRKIATYGASQLLEIAKENTKAISQLSKFRNKGLRKDWERVLDDARHRPNEETGKAGVTYDSVADLEKAYMEVVKRMPTETEVEAYFAWKRQVEMDRIFRNMAEYKARARLGVESHRLNPLGPQGTNSRVMSEFFDGAVQKHFPGGEGTIVIMGKKVGMESIYDLGHIDTAYLQKITKAVEEGRMKVIEIYKPEAYPLRGFGKISDQRIRYVVTDAVETKPLSWDQVPRQGGGHFEYDYNFYIKQAKINVEQVMNRSGKPSVRKWYDGDTTVMPMQLRSMGEDMVKHLEQIRIHLENGDIGAAKAYAQANKFPVPWKELHGWFLPKMVDGVTQAPRLSKTEPFRLVDKNKMIIDMDKELELRHGTVFRDGTTQGSMARQNQIEFTGERDAFEIFSVHDKGSRHNPLYAWEQAKMVDPVTSMNRALKKIVNSTFMDDYKIGAIEQWLREASKFLDAKDTELRYAPFKHFNDPVWKKVSAQDAAKVEALKANHFKIRQFLGIAHDTDKILTAANQKMADAMYGTFGPKALQFEPAWQWTLDKVVNPSEWVRKVAFHAKLGLFNFPQLWVQLQTYSTIFGIAGPGNALQGVYGTKLMTMARASSHNPKLIDHLDSLASKLRMPGNNWKPGEWKEAYEGMRNVGFDRVGGEYAALDYALNPKLVQNGIHKVFDAGTTFFRWGEQAVRDGAWFTAYKEFRKKNPTGRITDDGWRQILERADTLQVNMSRASNSVLHTGIASIPMQFLSYQIRMAELFFGKRLTGIEKARLLGTNAFLYGVPTTFGVTGFPVADYFRMAAMDGTIPFTNTQSGLSNYVVGDNFITSLLMEGAPAMAMALITGNGDFRAGNWYNIGDRWGVQGFETMREILMGDKTFLEIATGAAGSIVANTWNKSDGFVTAMSSMIGLGKGGAFPIKIEDIVDVFKEISSINNTWRTGVAIATGKWISKNDVHLDNVSAANAIFTAASGLQPQNVTDLHLISWSMKSQKELEKHVANQFIKEFRRGLNTGQDSPEQAKAFFTRAFTYLVAGNYPENKITDIISQAVRGNEALASRMDWDFYLRNVPKGQQGQRLDAFRAKKLIQDANTGVK